jgi:uncharacterized protein YbaR (Trm112 family)
MPKDALGQDISPESLDEAINAWNELWKSCTFDCGPQDYDCMAKEILEKFGVASEGNRQLATFACPYCGRETYDARIAAFDSVMMGRSTCKHCRREFLIEDGVPRSPD